MNRPRKPSSKMINLWAIALVGQDGNWAIAGSRDSKPETIAVTWNLEGDDLYPVRRYKIALAVPRPTEPEWTEITMATEDLLDCFELVDQSDQIDEVKDRLSAFDPVNRAALKRLLNEYEE